MMDKNKDILKKAIDNLPDYDPPELVWDKISSTLVTEKNEEAIQRNILNLPSYDPPPSSWEAISLKLSTDEASSTKVVPLWSKRVWGYAAAVALLVSIGLSVLWPEGSAQDRTYITMSTQEEMPLNVPAWNEDQEDFEVVLAEIEGNQFLRQNTDVNNLRYEYEELETAKQEVLTIMEQYGTDPQVIEQMNEIENARAAVIKKLVGFLVNIS